MKMMKMIIVIMVMWLLMQGKITAQGKLLLQDTLLVVEQSVKAPRVDKQAMKERRVFLFEQIVIFSEEIDKRKNNMSSPGYIYKNSIKVSSHVSYIIMNQIVVLHYSTYTFKKQLVKW